MVGGVLPNRGLSFGQLNLSTFKGRVLFVASLVVGTSSPGVDPVVALIKP